MTEGGTGQFDVRVDNEVIAGRRANWLTQRLGLGYPDATRVVQELAKRLSQ